MLCGQSFKGKLKPSVRHCGTLSVVEGGWYRKVHCSVNPGVLLEIIGWNPFA